MFINIDLIDYNNSGVYMIKNLDNNKIYIGSSINIKKRLLAHQSKFNRGINFNKCSMQDDWNNGDNFFISIIEKVDSNISRCELYKKEENYIVQYNSHLIGYNFCIGHSEPKEKNPMYNKKHNLQTIQKMKNKKLGKIHTTESCKKISESNKGKKHNLETIQKMKKSAKRGINHHNSKYKENDIIDICNRLNSGESMNSIGKNYSYKIVYNIKHKISHMDISDKYLK